MNTTTTAFLSSSVTARSGRRVLVVDDDRDCRDLFGIVLRRAAFTVELAESGGAALCRMADAKPDVITLDLAMPGLDGFALIERIRRLGPVPPIVVVTGGAYPEEAMTFGPPVVALLAKPLHPRDLVSACERAVRR